MTENLSCTGVLLRASRSLDVNTPVVLEMPVPTRVSGGARLRLFCEGQVVRVAPDPAQPNLMQIALAIGAFHSAVTNGPGSQEGNKVPSAQLRALLHDLNRQLAIVVGNADLLLSEPDTDVAITDRLREMKRGALEAAAIVQKLPT